MFHAKSGISIEELEHANFDLLVEPCASALARTLAQYPDVIKKAVKGLEPSTIVTYLFSVTHIVSPMLRYFMGFWSRKDVAIARLALYEAARQVINNGMTLLGLTPVNRM